MLRITRRFASAPKAHFKVGDFVKKNRIVSQSDLDKFSQLTCDHNPIHQQNSESRVHGAFLNSLVAGIIGTNFPGPGTLVVSQRFSFPTKCYIDQNIEIYIELVEMRKIMSIKYNCKQNEQFVFEGDAKLVTQK